MMIRTNEIELSNEVGGTYIDCYKGNDLRRTEISCIAWICQVLCGMVLCGNPVYFL
jgi:SP family general alpha glucoside:H+ symporter-like MFS transporter